VTGNLTKQRLSLPKLSIEARRIAELVYGEVCPADLAEALAKFSKLRVFKLYGSKTCYGFAQIVQRILDGKEELETEASRDPTLTPGAGVNAAHDGRE